MKTINKSKLFIVLIIFGLITTGNKIWALDNLNINVINFFGWNLTIDESDLEAGAGSDLVDSYESNSNETAIYITGCDWKLVGFKIVWEKWRVDVRRTDSNWDSDFVLWVKRTGEGFGGQWIDGGTSYMQVSATDSEFFNGAGNKMNVPVQLKLSGVSVQTIPPNTYETTVHYTVVSLGWDE